jgi:hypothetical protein
MMSRHHVVTIELTVNDAAALLDAATARAIADGAPVDDLVDAEGEPNTCACLQMLLDPGNLDGCDIEQSSAEEISL